MKTILDFFKNLFDRIISRRKNKHKDNNYPMW